MNVHGGFELEPDAPDAPAKPPLKSPSEAKKALGAPCMPSVRRMAAAAPAGPGLLSRLDPRVRRRLKRVVPTLAVLFVIVGWLFVGTGLWAFALAGAAVGAFSAFKRPGEGVLGPAAGAAGYGATALAIHAVPLGLGMVFIIGICGCLGALVAIDDRLGGP
jgi:hypothetical protein